MVAIDLSGKTALVIGGSRGIGAAIVRTFCRAGARTVFTHTGSGDGKKRAAALVKRMAREDGAVRAVGLDARDSAGTRALVDDIVRRHGRVDILVVNAGGYEPMPATDLTDEGWRRTLDVNLGGAFYAVRAVLPAMTKRQYGRIILIGSSAAVDGGGGVADYAAAKAGMHGLMLHLARNYARRGILANIIHPCVIDTDLLRKRYASLEARKALALQIPAGRLGRPEDIAGMAAYLASSWGDYVCGQAFLIDGGRTLGR